MKAIWVNKQVFSELILFFNGWGMDINVIKHLSCSNFDVCMFHNYSAISKLNIDLNNYQKIYIITWSLGTWVAAKVCKSLNERICKTIVFNGTYQPINLNYGINPQLFKQTLNNWSIKTQQKFYTRMLGGSKNYNLYKNILPERNIKEQKKELNFLCAQILTKKIVELHTSCAIIGRKDLIFTYKNQYNYWKNKTKIIEMDLPHYPFHVFKNWNEILSLAC